jgi:hypothetical protein
MLFPHERSLVNKMKGRPFSLIGVNCDPYTPEDLKKKNDAAQVTWRSFRGFSSTAWPVEARPTLFLLDAKGVIRRQWVRAPELGELNKAVEALVQKVEAGSAQYRK